MIEISLQSVTDPNTKLVLELWSILYDRGADSSPNNSSRVIYNVYNRMSLLLKSLLCVTRSLPAYKLSRKLSLSDEDEFKLYYNVFSAISLFKGERAGFFKPTKVKDTPQGASSPPKDCGDSGMLHEYIDYTNVLGEGYKFNQLGNVSQSSSCSLKLLKMFDLIVFHDVNLLFSAGGHTIRNADIGTSVPDQNGAFFQFKSRLLCAVYCWIIIEQSN